MASKGKKPVRSEMRINSSRLKQVNTFSYITDVTYLTKEKKDLSVKITKFVEVVQILNRIFKPSLVSRRTIVQIYKTCQTNIHCLMEMKYGQ
jgi:hypothetical protein